MNTTNLSIFRIPTETDAWFHFRTIGLSKEDCAKYNVEPYASGVGSSECALILGLQKKYRPCLQEVFHIKCNTLQYQQPTSRAMIRGKILESIVADIWKLNSDDSDSWKDTIMQFRDGDRELKKQLAVRNCRNLTGYYVNNQYPWLFASLDYFAEKNTPGILDGKIHKDGFPVEIKTVNQNYAKLWEAGIPIYHVVQLNQEMICTNSEYGEIAVLFPDDFSFKIFPFYKDKELCDRIIHWSKVFWDKVLESREAKVKMDKFYQDGNMDKGNEMQSIIDSNEPEPDDGEAYMEYIKERYKPGFQEEVEGEISLYYDTLDYKLAAEVGKLLDDRQRGIKNQILKLLETTGAQRINFGDMGKITYNEDKNKNRTLLLNTKSIMPLKDRAEQEFSKLNFDLKNL